jgi:hypothetical protein
MYSTWLPSPPFAVYVTTTWLGCRAWNGRPGGPAMASAAIAVTNSAAPRAVTLPSGGIARAPTEPDGGSGLPRWPASPEVWPRASARAPAKLNASPETDRACDSHVVVIQGRQLAVRWRVGGAGAGECTPPARPTGISIFTGHQSCELRGRTSATGIIGPESVGARFPIGPSGVQGDRRARRRPSPSPPRVWARGRERHTPCLAIAPSRDARRAVPTGGARCERTRTGAGGRVLDRSNWEPRAVDRCGSRGVNHRRRRLVMILRPVAIILRRLHRSPRWQTGRVTPLRRRRPTYSYRGSRTGPQGAACPVGQDACCLENTFPVFIPETPVDSRAGKGEEAKRDFHV